MNARLVISQPEPLAPSGKPFRLSYETPSGRLIVRWFALETAAWDARDDALDAGCRFVRVTGAPCNALVIG